MRWSESPPVARLRFASLEPFHRDSRALSAAVAHLVLVRRYAPRRLWLPTHTMILAFGILVISLFALGTYLSGLQRATLHWGRQIAGLAHIRRDIEEAKAADPTKAAELLGCSVHQTGFQDAITPPWHTKATFLYWALCLAAFIWGFFVVPWYVAVTWPVVFGVAKRLVGSLLPSPGSDFYRQKLIASLDSRCEQFRRGGDDMRLAAAGHMASLLRTSDQNV